MLRADWDVEHTLFSLSSIFSPLARQSDEDHRSASTSCTGSTAPDVSGKGKVVQVAATEKDEPARRSLGGRKTPQCRAKSGPVFATDGVVGQLFNSETNEFQETSASTKHLYTPSAGLWRSMEDSVKEVGSAADQFNPAGTNTLGLTSFGDSALNLDPGQALKKAGESASKFDAVHSLKQFGESAHSAASMFGRSAIQINLAKDPFNLLLKSGPFLEENKEPEQIKSAAHGGRVADINGTDLKLVKSKESHLALVSPWRDRDGILHAIPQKSPTGESDKSQNAGKSSETQSLHLDEVEEGPKVWTQGASVALEPVTPTPQMAVGIREVSAPFISRAHSTPSHTSPHSNLQVVAEKPEEWRGIEPIRNANEMEATGIGLHTISKGLESAMAELGHLRAAFEQDGNAMMSAHNHCVKTLQIARRDAQNARAKLADSSKHSSAASAQDLVALCNEVEALCTQLEQARAQLLSERQRREEAEQLLRKVNKTLANHIVADKIRNEEESKELLALQSKLEREIQHRKSLENELDQCKSNSATPIPGEDAVLVQLQKEVLAEADARRRLEKSLLSLKELYAEQERERVAEIEKQDADMTVLRRDLHQERKLREAVEDEMRRVRSVSLTSGESSAFLSELLCKAAAESSQLRDEKSKSDSHARNSSLQLQEITSSQTDNGRADAINALERDLEECRNKLHEEEIAHQETMRRNEDFAKKLEIAMTDFATCIEEKTDAMRETARLKISLNALKPDYEAACARAEDLRKQKLKLQQQIAEANLSVNELKAHLTESQLKRAAAERSVTEMHAKLELQNETENNRSKFDERRGRDFERLQKDFEQEKAQRLHEEEHVLQVRSDLKANDERDRQKDTLVQRELETLRAAIQNERQHRKVDARSEELTEGRVGALPENISRLDHDIPKTSLQQIETKTAAQFKTKTVMESQNAEMQQEDSRLRASKQLEPVPCTENSDKSGGDGASLTLQLDIREKEVTRLSEEVANLKSSLAASRAENSMLAERIHYVNSGSDGDAPGIPFQPGAGSGELSRGQDKRGSNSASDLAKSVQFVLEQERSKWEKEKKSLQAQVAKLLQVRGSYPSTCVHARLPAFF